MSKLNLTFVVGHLAKGAAVGATLLMLGMQGATAGGQHNMGAMTHPASPVGFAFGEPGQPTQVDRTVQLTMGDMNFDPASVQVGVGATIRFVVTNKSEIEHDFTIGDGETQTAHRAEMAEALEKGEMEHGDDPNAVLVDAGESRELLWKFTRAGSFEFDCNIPGHYEAGMRGVITVGDKAQPAPTSGRAPFGDGAVAS
jgi:uncharacterized cupredoxin-like copper-binding protein